MSIRGILFAAALLALLGLTGATPDTVNAGALRDHSHVPGGGLLPMISAPAGTDIAANQQILAGAGVFAATIPLTLPPMAVPPKNPKIDSHLVELTASQLAAAAAGPPELPPDLQSMIKAGLMRIDDAGRVQIYVQSLDDIASTAEAVNRAGGLVQRQDAKSGIVQALLPMPEISGLATSPSVRFVRLPDYGFPQAGSVTTEGDSILRANLARADRGLDGSGVRVGVISSGVGGLSSSQASGDLPAVNTSTCNETGADPTSSGAEGTAMLEIVHDLAPGAELWFGHFSTSLDFNDAVTCLAQHTDVVVDDISFVGVGPYDGTSVVSSNTSSQLNKSTSPIRAYVTNAGNFVRQHYEDPYQACGSTTRQTFRGTAHTIDMNGIGAGCGDPLYVPGGATVYVDLQWNDPWGASCNDYDLYLYTLDGSFQLAASGNAQTCSQDPEEITGWTNPLSTGLWIQAVVDNFHGLAAPRTLDLFAIGSAGEGAFPFNFYTPYNSIPNQADAGGGVITAGAVPANDINNIEPYSDQGPTVDGRTKPDITGVDCVSVTGAGGFPSTFCGTSAAAPHIAGIAALLLQCDLSLKAGEPGDNPAADRARLRNALLNNAVDLGATGPDNVYGWGRADAKASADSICQQASPSPTQSPTPTPAHSPGPTPTHTPGGGAIWGDLNCSGHVDAADAGAGLSALSGAPHAAGACSAATDLDCSGQFNGADVLAILRYLVNLAISVPGCTPIGVRP